MSPNEILAVCSGILILNLLFLANGTALNRARAGKYRNPEDEKLNKKGTLQEVDDGIVARYRRAHMNALENILPFLPIAFLFTMTGPSVTVTWIFLGIFTFFRLLHSFAYIKSLQPWRTMSFAIAALDLFALTVYTVVQFLRLEHL